MSRRKRFGPGRRSGFTLIEILLVIAIIGLVMGVSFPVSYNMYLNYKSALRAEEVLTYVSAVRRESFLYGEETVLSSKEGSIRQNTGAAPSFAGVFIQIDAPIKFYKNGTTSGGVLKIQAGDSLFRLNVTPPFGNLFLERDT